MFKGVINVLFKKTDVLVLADFFQYQIKCKHPKISQNELSDKLGHFLNSF